MTNPRKCLSAAILYESLPSPNPSDIRESVNAGLGAFGLSFDPCTKADDEIVALTNNVLRIAVRADGSALPPARLTAPLASRFTQARPFDYASPLAAHRAVLTITVTDQRAAPPDDIPDDTLIVVTHATLAAILSRTLALMVHWHLTDMLYLPHEIPTLRGIGFPVALATRPELSPARPDARGRPRLGILAAQSERYFGKPVRVEPTSHPLADCLAVIDFCILRKLCGQDVLIDGTTIALPGQVEVAVRALPPQAGFPLGLISLTISAPTPSLRPALADSTAFHARTTTPAPVARMTPRSRPSPKDRRAN